MKEDLFEDDCEDDLQITSMSVVSLILANISKGEPGHKRPPQRAQRSHAGIP
jgi:hypothetical protein